MNEISNALPHQEPKIRPVLDPDFKPVALTLRAMTALGDANLTPVNVALERSPDSISRSTFHLIDPSHPASCWNSYLLERNIKFLLWSKGAHRIYCDADSGLVDGLAKHYREDPIGRFDAEMMGTKIYRAPFEVRYVADWKDLPDAQENSLPLGGDLKGCRIGFDLGASDRKAAAVIDGKVVFSEEIVWNPNPQTDPNWHFNEIMDSLKRAAAHLPRVDAIGGSSAGVLVNNQPRVASLFRGISESDFKSNILPLFQNLKKAWGDIPFEIVNDGEVTALAGAMAIGDNGVLGIAMGSSLAAGYVNTDGFITPWLNELAFVPVDYRTDGPVDEWSKDRGCGVQYFSQQAVARLIPLSGLSVDTSLSFPEQLVQVQEAMKQGDERAAKIYQTIGVYLGYAMAQFKETYDYRYLLTLGRVTTGEGGQIILDEARNVLKLEFPELDSKLQFHVPDEKEKRHGQAIAAAGLPRVEN